MSNLATPPPRKIDNGHFGNCVQQEPLLTNKLYQLNERFENLEFALRLSAYIGYSYHTTIYDVFITKNDIEVFIVDDKISLFDYLFCPLRSLQNSCLQSRS